jgi:hypothetical protein
VHVRCLSVTSSLSSDSYDIEDTGYRSEHCKGVFYGECHDVQCTLNYCSAVQCSVLWSEQCKVENAVYRKTENGSDVLLSVAQFVVVLYSTQ